ncbi:MAG: hypothetical protein LC778_21240 [Acidobacteria bacterium]|nr:hypothetical protein [Acidobacteriota bacterium]
MSIFKASVGTHVHDLSIDKRDIIYGWYNSYEPRTEKHLRSFWKISPDGEFTEIVSLTENVPSGMSIWRDSDGNTYSVEPWSNERRESKIIKRTPDGKTSLFAGGNYGYLDGKKERAKFGNILDMAFAGDNSIYITDTNRVRKIDKFGAVKTLYPTDDAQRNQSQLFGLTVDKQNNVFVADFAGRRLLKIDSSGKTSIVLASDKDWSPLGVATIDDEIYILEGKTYESKSQGNRVLKISSDNQKTVVADLKDSNKTSNSLNLNDKNPQPQTKENNNLNSIVSNENQSNQTENKKLGLYGIVGAVIAAFTAFAFFRKNKFIG